MWQAYRVVYRLESPLHVGWRKVGNLMQTRPYILGRNLWGAATAQLARWSGSNDYVAVGDFVKQHLIFGYFFPAFASGEVFIPRWNDGAFTFGNHSAAEFEREFLRSFASTAIEAESNSAAEGQLHEVEYIVPKVEGNQVLMVGHLIVAENDRIKCDPPEVLVDGLPLFSRVLKEIQIGGERRYGWGKLVYQGSTREPGIFGHELKTVNGKPVIEIKAGESLPAHFRVEGLRAHGEIEPLLGREWNQTTGPGRQLSQAEICYVPGSVVEERKVKISATIQPMGIGSLVLSPQR
jgi:hypothetical protein